MNLTVGALVASCPNLSTLRTKVAGLALFGILAGCGSEAPVGPQLQIEVAPLTLPGLERACYSLAITNASGAPVWSKGNLCSDRYGTGASGDISFVGTCDATDTGDGIDNTVTLRIDGLYGWPNPNAPGTPPAPALNDWVNPCGAPLAPNGCQVTTPCLENQDRPVVFDLTIMRKAQQGFFDVAVNFEDVFCSAKIDCQESLMHHPVTGERGPTVVTALTCGAGPSDTGETTFVGMSQAFMCCSNGNRVECTVLDGPTRAGVADKRAYQGVNEALGGRYFNTSWRLDEAYLQAQSGQCIFSAMGFVNTAPEGQTPATTYVTGRPAFHYSARIGADASCLEASLDVSYNNVPPNGPADCSPLPDVGPDQPETCNGRDDNCDGQVDEDFIPGVTCDPQTDANCPCIPPDTDADGIPDAVDNCPFHFNPNQGDIDNDGYGDSCDDDMDGDGRKNAVDNCPGVPNADQRDQNFDGVGDACEGLETLCGDGILDLGEQCDHGPLNSDFNSGACRTNCLWGYCGDGVVDPPAEGCDDGNQLAGDGCDPGCVPAALGGTAPPANPTTFGNSSSGSDPYAGWHNDGFQVGTSAAIPTPHAYEYEPTPGAPVDVSITSTVYDLSGWDQYGDYGVVTITGAVMPNPLTGLNPNNEDGSTGIGGGGSSGGFGGGSSSLGAYYGGNASSGGSGSGWGTGTGGSSSGSLGGYTSGNAGQTGSGGASGPYSGTAYPGSQVTTYIEVTYDGGVTWHIVEAIQGYWQGTQSLRIPLHDPGEPTVPGPGVQVRVRTEGVAGDQGLYVGVGGAHLGHSNLPPELSPRPSSIIVERGEVRELDLTVTDTDGPGAPQLVLLGGPSFVTFTSTGPGRGRLSIAPPVGAVSGWYQLRLGYSDGALYPDHWINIVVPPPPLPPVHRIVIRNAPNGGGSEVGALTLARGDKTTFYAAAYASDGTYLGEANVRWQHSGTLPEETLGPFAIYVYTAHAGTGSGTITTVHPSPTVLNDATGTITLTPEPAGPLSLTRSTLAATPSAIIADGAATTTLVAHLKDSRRRSVLVPHTVAFQVEDGTLVGPVTARGDGTYTQTLRASTTLGPVQVTATVDGQPLTATTTVTFTEIRNANAILQQLGSSTLDCTNAHHFAGQDLVISTAVTLDTAGCPLSLNHLTVTATGTLTHSAIPTTPTNITRALDLSVQSLTIATGGKIDVSGKGYAAARNYGNTTYANGHAFFGGTHAGIGGRPPTAFSYGDFRDPKDAGGGSVNIAGGGIARITVRPGGHAHIDGQILANGTSSTAGGAGGSIYLRTPSLSGSGTFSARGGNAANSSYGSGGGGRIALIVPGGLAFPLADLSTRASACGGINTTVNYDGGAGTLYYEGLGATAGLLIVDGCGETPADRSTPLVVPPDGAYAALSPTGLSATFPVPAERFVGAGLNLASGAGFPGLYDDPWAKLTGLGTLDRDLTASAPASGTYRGYTVVGMLEVKNGARLDAVGDLYLLAGSLQDPNVFRLDGRLDARRLDLGNSGQIVIENEGHLAVTQDLITRNRLDYPFPFTLAGGTLNANASTPIGSVTAHSGGALAGSGTVLGNAVFDLPQSTVSTFQFRSDLTIRGGSWAATDITVGGDLNVFGGAFTARHAAVTGSAVFDAGVTVTLDGLTAPSGKRGIEALGDIIARGANTTLTHTAVGAVTGNERRLALRGHNVRILTPATINVAAKGWAAGSGPTATWRADSTGEGGSHGGRGGGNNLDTRAPVFDSLENPLLPGGGGANNGVGGGALVIEATEAIVVGDVNASGSSSTTGGAGGTINLRAGQSVRVDGTLDARGGHATQNNTTYWGGGGGRIAVVSGGVLQGALATQPASIALVSGGRNNNHAQSAGSGTLYVKHGAALPSLFLDNANLPNTQLDSTPLPISGTGLFVAVGGGIRPATATDFDVQADLVGTHLFVPATGARFTVTGIDAGTNAWRVDGDPSASLAHPFCVIHDLAHLDVRNHAQLQSRGCIRVTSSNHADPTPATYDLGGGLNVTRLDLGPVTSLVMTGPAVRFDIGTQLGNGNVVGYPFDATLNGRLTANNLRLRDLTVTTAETTYPTVLVGQTLTLTRDYLATTTPQPVRLQVGHAVVGRDFTHTGGRLDLGGLTAARDIALTHTEVELTGQGSGLHADQTLTLTGLGTVVRHTIHDLNLTDRRMVRLSGNTVELVDGARIDVKGRGFRGDSRGYAPLEGLRADLYEGGSHGGRGGASVLTNRPPTYDNLYKPTLAGGAGGNGNAHGGGVAHIIATTRARIDGNIDASAATSGNTCGGAGGAIYIEAAHTTVDGFLNVAGEDGNTSGTHCYPGGGGMIAVVAHTTLDGALAGPTPWNRVNIAGGYSTVIGLAAGAGTLYTRVAQAAGDLLVDNGPNANRPVLTDSTSLPFQWFSASTAIGATSVNLPTTATAPYRVTLPWPPVGYRLNPRFTQGATNLADDITFLVTAVAGQALTVDGDPSAIGQTGDIGCAHYTFDHVDIRNRAQLEVVGCLRIHAANRGQAAETFTVDGGLNVSVLDLNGVETVALTGGQSRFDAHIQIGHDTAGYPFDFMASGAVTTSGLTTGHFTTQSGTSLTVTGDIDVAGDLLLPSTTLTAQEITVGGAATLTGGTSTVDGLQTGQDLRFEGGHVVTVRGKGTGLTAGGDVVLTGANTRATHQAHDTINGDRRKLYIEGTDVVVEAGASLDVSGRGYPATYGPTAALAASGTARGGSHGGRGAWSSPSARADAYDDIAAPDWAGGGGGSSGAGTGGGIAHVVARNDLTLAAARANANATGSSTPASRPGGAGGTIRLWAANTLDATLLEAKGGDGANASFAGGGGGRISVIADTFQGPLGRPTLDTAFAAALDTRGGYAGYADGAGGAGTVYLRSSVYEQGVLIVDNEGLVTQRDSTPLRGARGTIVSAGDDFIQVGSAAPFSTWSPVGLTVTVAPDEGTASLGDNTRFRVTGQSGTRLDLDADPSDVVGASWAFLYVFDHLEIRGNAQVDATDALIRVSDGSLELGDAAFRVVGGLSDTNTESEGLAAHLVLDLDTVTHLHLHGPQTRFDVPRLVQGDTAQPAFTQLTTSGVVELEQLRVQRLDAGDVTGTLHDLRALETVEDLNLTGVNLEVTGYGPGLSTGAGRTLTLGSGTTATHQAHTATGDLRRLALTAGTVRLATGATIDVTGKGFAATQAPSAAFVSGTSFGGSHCGRGYGTPSGRPPAYDDIFAPSLGGAGGGPSGQYGGGAVRIAASGLVELRGTVRADGLGSAAHAGAGGAIHVTGDVIDLDGAAQAMTARGGATTNTNYRVGGGGCIALVADTSLGGVLAGLTPWTHVRAHGGQVSTTAGGAGTIYLRAGSADGDLIVDNDGATGTQDDSTELPALPAGTIGAANGTQLTVTGNFGAVRPAARRQIRLVTADETPALGDELVRHVTGIAGQTLTLDGDATPFAGQAYASFYRFDRLEIRGNAHLTTDAHLRIDHSDFTPPHTNWALHGALVAPHVDLAGVTDLAFSGPNSRFDVPKDVSDPTLDPRWNTTISGTLRVPELNTTSLTAHNVALKDVARLTVHGDLAFTDTSCDEHTLTSGSPGCGVIDVTGTATWTGGFIELQTLRAGQDLTLTNTQLELHGHADGLPAGFVDGLHATGHLTMSGASFLLDHDAPPRTLGATRRAQVIGQTVTLGANAIIDVSGRGFAGGTSGDQNGYAPTTALRTQRYVGGSHLGLGAYSTLSTRRPTFDAYWAPAWPGAGGGFGSTAEGGRGGGVVRLHGQTHVQLDGQIYANGNRRDITPNHREGGGIGAGGAGGAVWLTSGGTLDQQGRIEARGGQGNGAQNGWGGGGGAISLVASVLSGKAVSATPWADLVTAGGVGGEVAGAGTTFVRSLASDLWGGHLVVDNLGQTTTQADSTPLVFTGSGLWANHGVLFDAGTTTLTSTTNAFLASTAPIGFFVNPRIGQPVGAATPTLGDDQIFPIAAATATALTVSGDASNVATSGGAYRPHYRFDTLTVRGNAQLSGDAEVYVRDGHWQDGDRRFSVVGGVNLTALDLNAVTELSVTGPQGRWQVAELYARDSATPRFTATLGGTLTVGTLRTDTLTLNGVNLALTELLDVEGDLTLINSNVTGAKTIDVSAHLAIQGGSVTATPVTANSATITGGAHQLTTLDIATSLIATNTNLTSTTTTADTVTLDGGVYNLTNLHVAGQLTTLSSADLTSDVVTAATASFSGAQADIRYRYMDIVDDVTFAGGARFEQRGREDDATAPDGLFAGRTVLLTGTGSDGPTAGTHLAHGTSAGERRVLRIEADIVRVESGAILDVDGKGYPGRDSAPAYAPNPTNHGALRHHGGSHIGIAHPDVHTNRKSYDNVFLPSWAGAGGGEGYYRIQSSTTICGYYNCAGNYSCSQRCSTYSHAGGTGGGVIHLVARSHIDLTGPVHARGMPSSNAPGGAGGAIALQAPVIRLVGGELRVNGGQGAFVSNAYAANERFQWGGAGGGVAVIAGERVEGILLSQAPWTAVDLRGGLMNATDAAGAGTYYLEVAGVRTLVSDNRDQPGTTAHTTPLPFSGGTTINSVSPTGFTAANNSTFAKWSPVGYFVNPNIAQAASLADVDYFQITNVAGTTFTLDDDPRTVAQAGNTWRPFYDVDHLEVRGNAKLYAEGQLLVREGSLTPVGTAGTTTMGSPAQIAVAGTLTVGTLEVLAPAPTVGLTGARTVADPGRFADGTIAPRCDAYRRPELPGYTYSGATGDGVYQIDPDGSGGNAPFPAYCDMTTDGGGWTKVESATYPHVFTLANWTALNGAAPLADNYSALHARAHFESDGCFTYRFEVGDTGNWLSGRRHHTVWQQCHDPFTQRTDGAGYTFLAGETSTTCGGFNGLHNTYLGNSRATDVDSTDSINCWFMQVVPTALYSSGAGYLDGYGGAYYDRRWQSLWLRAGALALTPATATLGPGNSRTFQAHGGQAPYSYQVLSLQGGVMAGTTYTAPATAGLYVVRVTDALGHTADAKVTVTSALNLDPTTAAIGTTQTQVFTASGGVPPYTYGITSGGGTLNGATYTAPATAGTATVQVTDALGNTADATITISLALCSNGSGVDCNVAGTTLIATSRFVDPNPPAGWTQCAGFINTTGDDVTHNFLDNCLNSTRLRLRVWTLDDVLEDDVHNTGHNSYAAWPNGNYLGGTQTALVRTYWTVANFFYTKTNGTDACNQASAPSGTTVGTGHGSTGLIAGGNTNAAEYRVSCGGASLPNRKIAFYR